MTRDGRPSGLIKVILCLAAGGALQMCLRTIYANKFLHIISVCLEQLYIVFHKVY